MLNLLFMTNDANSYIALEQSLSRRGILCDFTGLGTDPVETVADREVDILVIEIERQQSLSGDSKLWDQLGDIKQYKKLPVILVIPRNFIELLDSRPELNDFISKPVDPVEMEVRIKRCLKLVGSGSEVIKSGDMVIDLAQAEVYIAGKAVELTFKEYELLKFLATNKNRVYTREALLNELWGYDYFGGDRTVDVHIRRLRSKIEDAEHSFIETVRNIGYKFKDAG